MNETCYVICTDDYPDCVVIGSEEDAAEEALKVRKKCEELYPGRGVYVHIRQVPLLTKQKAADDSTKESIEKLREEVRDLRDSIPRPAPDFADI